jgi:alcohol dehydrogenase (cytochrome c)
MQADRNGMFYVLDRTDGKFILAKPYVKETWNLGYDKDGHPILAPKWKSSPEGNIVFPTLGGGSNWQSPSYDPVRSLLYVAARNGGYGYRSGEVKFEAGRQYIGGVPYLANVEQGQSGVMAIDTKTGMVKWVFPISNMSAAAGVLATAGGLVFVSTAEGNLIALDSDSGKSLWHFQTGASIASSAMSYAIDGKQYIAVAAGNVLYSFALPD